MKKIYDKKKFLFKRASEELIKTVGEGKPFPKKFKKMYLDNHPEGKKAKDKDGNIRINWSLNGKIIDDF